MSDAYDAHAVADEVVARLAAEKIGVSVAKSTNRYRQKSAYLSVPAVGEVRVSDHSTNLDFRPGLRADYSSWSADKIVADLLARIAEWHAAAPRREARRQEIAAIEATRRASKEELWAEERANRQRKADFLASRPDLANATETARKQAWEAHKKASRATA